MKRSFRSYKNLVRSNDGSCSHNILILLVILLFFGSSIVTVLNGVGALEINTTGDGSTTKDIYFHSAGFNNTTTIKLNKNATVQSARMNITGLPYLNGGSEYSTNVTLDVGENGTVEWAFNGTGYGSYGRQFEFSDDTTTKNIILTGAGSDTNAKLRLPKTANVQSATLNVTVKGSAVYLNSTIYPPSTVGWTSMDNATDVNNDGKNDLIVGQSSVNKAYIFFGGSSMNQTPDITLSVGQIDDAFGFSVAGAGDVNNDGYDDVIVGAYLNDSGGLNAGRAYIFYGGNPMNTNVDVTLTGGSAGDYFGYSVAGAGNVNGDSYYDVVVGAYQNASGGANAGRVYAFFGNSPMDNTADILMNGSAGDKLGYSVSGMVDINNDGYDDLVAGTYGNDSAHIYYGGSPMDGMADVNISFPGSTIFGTAYFGYTVRGIGDVNSDGYGDMAVGAPLSASGPGNIASSVYGSVYIYEGNSTAKMDAVDDWNISLNCRIWDVCGGYFARAGDLNSDGYDDLLIANSSTDVVMVFNGGSPMDNVSDINISDAGSGFVLAGFGDRNGDTYSDIAISNSMGNRINVFDGGSSMDTVKDETLFGEASANARFGNVMDIADVNNDGNPDIIVGASGEGKVYIFFGGGNRIPTIPNVTISGSIDDAFGSSVAGAGDVNNDGYDDVIVGAYLNDSGGLNAGRAYIFYGGNPMNTNVDVTLTGGSAGDYFGYSVAGAGNVNGDSYYDVVVGAYQNASGGANAGRVYAFFGNSPMDNTADILMNGSAGDKLGYSVSGMVDINNDGYDDLVAGTYGNDSAHIYYGGSPMDGMADVNISFPGTSIFGTAYFGYTVRGIGDVNNDGYGDMAVGAPMSASGPGNIASSVYGSVYIYEGNSTAKMDAVDDWNISLNCRIWDVCGGYFAQAGDLNSDGYDDLLIANSSTDVVMVFNGGSPMDNVNDNSMQGESGSDFGNSLRGLMDFDADGYNDFAVGAPLMDVGGINAGRIFIFYNTTGVLDPAINVGNTGTDDWSKSGAYNGTETMLDFSTKLNTVLSTCIATTDAWGNDYCDIPIAASTNSAGNFTLENINITYNCTYRIPDFSSELQWYINNNQAKADAEDNISIPLNFTSDTKGRLRIGSIRVVFTLPGNPPVIDPIPDQTATEEKPFTYLVNATDPDGNPVLYSISGAPSGMTMNNTTGVISWVPTNAQAAKVYSLITVRATDKTNLSEYNETTLNITVTNVNDVPYFTSEPISVATEEVAYAYDVNASDDDLLNPSGESLTYSLVTSPVGMTINATTGVIDWTPSNAQAARTHNVSVNVTDWDVIVLQNFTISVFNTNDAPTITSSAVVTATEEVLYTYDVDATDDDLNNPSGEQLIYQLNIAPAGMVINATDGNITWTPTNAQAAQSHNVVVNVSDGDTWTTQSYNLAVTNTNDAPNITSNPVSTATEEVQYAYQVQAVDDDLDNPSGEALTYILDEAPAGMSINVSTGKINWTPTNAQAAQVHNVTVNVSDGDTFVLQKYNITVFNINDGPSITSNAVTAATEEVLYNYDVNATDDDLNNPSGEQLIYQLDLAPAGMVINATDGNITWTPTNAQAAQSHNVVVNVSDGENWTSQAFNILVTNTNDPPAITSSPIRVATEEIAYTYQVNANDDDLSNPSNEQLTYNLDDSPTGMSIDNSGKITWTPTNAQAAQVHNVTVNVSDGDTFVLQTFNISVINTNDVPSITSSALTVATEEVIYNYIVVADDDDLNNPSGEQLVYQLDLAPAGMVINATDGNITWTPTNIQAAQSHNVVVNVSDGDSWTLQSFSIMVSNSNDPPVFVTLPIHEATEEVPYTYDADAEDDDLLNPSGESLTYNLVESPTGMTINGNTGLIEWTPTNLQAAQTHLVVVKVSDGEAQDYQHFNVTVVNVNDPPVVTSTPGTTATEGLEYSYQIKVTDEDMDNPSGDMVTFELEFFPDGMTMDRVSGLVSWTPTNEQAAQTHMIRVLAHDAQTTVGQTWNITVMNINEGPVITSNPVLEAIEEVEYTYQVIASDPDPTNDPLTYSLTESPTNMSIDAASGKITWTPTNEEAATDHSVIVSVSDGELSATQEFLISVGNVNDPVSFTSKPVTEAVEEVQYTYDAKADDDDLDNPSGKALSFKLVSGPEGMTIGEMSGIMTWTPTNEQAAQVHHVVISVTDGKTEATQKFDVTVENTNDAPAITSIPIKIAEEGENYIYDVTANDDDMDNPSGEELEYSVTGPEGMAIESDTGKIVWIPTNDQAGKTHTIVVKVSDGEDTVEQNFDIAVSNSNGPPTNARIVTPEEGAVMKAGKKATFTGEASDEDLIHGDELTYIWYDNEQIIGMGKDLETTITEPGNHVITLEVMDKYGGDVSISTTVKVKAEPEDTSISPMMAMNIIGWILVIIIATVAAVLFLKLRSERKGI